MGAGEEVQILLEAGVAGGRAGGEKGGRGDEAVGGGDGDVVILGAGIAAEGELPAVGHAVAVDVARDGAGFERAEAGVGHGQVGLAGDHAAAEVDQVVDEQRVHLVAQRERGAGVEAQRAGGGDDFLVGEARRDGRDRGGAVGGQALGGGGVNAGGDGVTEVLAVEGGVAVFVEEVVGDVEGEVGFSLAVEAGLFEGDGAEVAGRADEVVADDVGAPVHGRPRVAEDEADVPVEGDVVDPFEQAERAGLGIAGVIVGPERVERGGVFLVPEAAAGVVLQAPGVDRVLKREVVGRALETGHVLVGRELHRDVVEDGAVGLFVEVHAIAAGAALAVAEAHMADDDVLGGEEHGAVAEADAAARRGLAGDGDTGLGDAQVFARYGDVAGDGEDDGAAGVGRGGDGVGEGARAGALEIGDGVNITAASAGGVGAETLGPGEGGDAGVQERGRGEEGERGEDAENGTTGHGAGSPGTS